MRVMPPKGARVRCSPRTSPSEVRTGRAFQPCVRLRMASLFNEPRITLITTDRKINDDAAGDGSVPRTGDPSNGNGSTEAAINDRGYNFPNSKKIYVSGELHLEVRVPFREISLAPTKSINGESEVNEPMRIYDTSGPWGDPDFDGAVEQGLAPSRAKWI